VSDRSGPMFAADELRHRAEGADHPVFEPMVELTRDESIALAELVEAVGWSFGYAGDATPEQSDFDLQSEALAHVLIAFKRGRP
jgi:hypothetical protein